MGYREKVVKYAQSQIGVCEPSGDDKFIKEYNRITGAAFAMNVPWCCIYATCCLRAAEVKEEVFGNFASCSAAIKEAKAKGIWRPQGSGYIPLPGDWVMFDWGPNGAVDHVGVVEKTTSTTVVSIEGNTRNGNVKDGVYRKSYPLTSKNILGYIAIPYEDEVSQIPAVEVPSIPSSASSSSNKIRSVQKVLNKRFNGNLTVDGIVGPKTKKAIVKGIQSTLNSPYGADLVVDGIWGPKSKAAFPNVFYGQQSDLVRLVQCLLIVHGATLDIDGAFGSNTKTAVIDYQKTHSLSPDGIVGKLTITNMIDEV